ncbi:MAG: serine/threonine-protein kinase [Cyanobacteria bacterium P01_F01_bin.53]
MSKIVGGHYQLERRLAAGGFGQTFVARDIHLPGQPLCVIKQLKPQFSDPAALKTAQRLFDQEAKTLYALGEHAQIPRLLAHFEEDQEFYLAQELVEGQPLSALLVLGQQWSESEAIALTQDILQVLSFVHQQRVIHRDIKPANLLWRETDGRIVLIDFGAVKAVQSATQLPVAGNQTSLTIAIGTPGYMPSEQQSGKPRFSSDVYSVGMTVIQAVTGVGQYQLVPDDASGEIVWRQHAPHLSEPFAALLDHMVRYDWRDRPTDATEALQRLRDLPAQTLATVPTQTYLPPSVVPTVRFTPERLSELPTVAAFNARSNQSQDNQFKEGEIVSPQKNNQQQGLPLKNLLVGASLLSVLGLGGLAVTRWQASSSTGVSDFLVNTPLTDDLAVASSVNSASITERPVTDAVAADSTVVIGSNVTIGSAGGSATFDSDVESNFEGPLSEAVRAPLSAAEEAYAEGDYATALSQYDAVAQLGIELDLDNDALNEAVEWGRCLSLYQLGDGEALQACTYAAGVESDSFVSVAIGGMHLTGRGQHERALVLFALADQMQPGHVTIRLGQGMALNGLGRYAEALTRLDEGLDYSAETPQVWVERGESLIALGRIDEAIASAEEALKLEVKMPEAIALKRKARAMR